MNQNDVTLTDVKMFCNSLTPEDVCAIVQTHPSEYRYLLDDWMSDKTRQSSSFEMTF